MLLVAPDRVAGVLQEWASVTADVLDKYYSLSLRFTQRVGDLPPETRPPPAELCLLCAQQIKKVEVDRVRRHILNEADLYQLADDAHQDPPAEDEDLAFFADLSVSSPPLRNCFPAARANFYGTNYRWACTRRKQRLPWPRWWRSRTASQ